MAVDSDNVTMVDMRSIYDTEDIGEEYSDDC